MKLIFVHLVTLVVNSIVGHTLSPSEVELLIIAKLDLTKLSYDVKD